MYMGLRERGLWIYTEVNNPIHRGYESDTYKGRRIITRDSEINKGISFVENTEAIVVDDEKQPLLQLTYSNCLNRILSKSGKKGHGYKQFVLPEVYDTVSRSIPSYSQEKLDRLHEQYGIKPKQKVGLDVYIGNGGMCRHQALLGGYLLERLGNEGYIGGRASIERNIIGDNGHAWVRYTNSQGEIYIVDTARQYLGSLQESLKVRGGWDYRRPEEQ